MFLETVICVFDTVKIKDNFIFYYDLRHNAFFYLVERIELGKRGWKIIEDGVRLNLSYFDFLGATFARTNRVTFNICAGSGRAVHYIFAATNFSFQSRKFRVGSKGCHFHPLRRQKFSKQPKSILRNNSLVQ